MRLADPQIDQGLRQQVNSGDAQRVKAFQSSLNLREVLKEEMVDNKANIFLPTIGLSIARQEAIPLATIKLVQRTGSQRWLLLESFDQLAHSDPSAFLRDVRDMGRKLSQCDALEFRLFNCHDVLRNFDGVKQHPSSCTFVYRMPEGLHEP